MLGCLPHVEVEKGEIPKIFFGTRCVNRRRESFKPHHRGWSDEKPYQSAASSAKVDEHPAGVLCGKYLRFNTAHLVVSNGTERLDNHHEKSQVCIRVEGCCSRWI